MMEQSETCSMDKKDCCENKAYHFQADDTQQVKTDDFVEGLPLQRALIAQVFQLSKQQLIETDTPDFSNYRPPLIYRDIPVLIQSFLLYLEIQCEHTLDFLSVFGLLQKSLDCSDWSI
jgi:hypothetical protein